MRTIRDIVADMRTWGWTPGRTPSAMMNFWADELEKLESAERVAYIALDTAGTPSGAWRNERTAHIAVHRTLDRVVPVYAAPQPQIVSRAKFLEELRRNFDPMSTLEDIAVKAMMDIGIKVRP